jgi:hypothetical protein
LRSFGGSGGTWITSELEAAAEDDAIAWLQKAPGGPTGLQKAPGAD